MKNEMIKKIESAKNYLKRWKADTNEQIIKNHISSIFNDLCDIENLANGDEQSVSTCNLQNVSVSFCPKCNSKNVEPYNTPSCECKDCKSYWAI